VVISRLPPFYRPLLTRLYLQIDGLLLDDKALPPVTWYSIDASMSTANIDLPSDQKVEFSLTNEVPFGAYLYGSTDRESYALPLGIRKVDLK